MSDADLIVDLFAGPGGWSEGLRLLGLADIGFEWDASACATRAAAGHRTIRADVAAWPIEPLIGRVDGLIASPPCQLFSTAGTKVGRGAIDLLAAGIRDLAAGRDTRAEIRVEAAAVIAAGLKAQADDADDGSGDRIIAYAEADEKAERLAYNACLVLEPARWAFTLQPRWIALEQVPGVLPLWQELARSLWTKGYRTWTGILNSADYGVPQTRRRAILMAHLDRPLAAPEPTHAEHPEATLFGAALEPWVTMADALGWGGRMHTNNRTTSETGSGYYERETGEPAPTVTGKVALWRGEGLLRTSNRPADRGTEGIDGVREREHHAVDKPAPVVTTKAGEWELRPGGFRGTDSERRRYRMGDEPSPTLAFGMDFTGWRWFEVEPEDAPDDEVESPGSLNTGRDWPEDGDRAGAQTVDVDQPAPTVSGQADAWRWQDRRNDQTGAGADPDWPLERPATTIAGRGLVPDPGANSNRFNDSDKSRNDGYRITVPEAAILQSFHHRYPWQGSQTKQFEQVGNAVPPLLAAHVAHTLVGT